MTNVTVPPPSAPADTPITFLTRFFLSFSLHFSSGPHTIFNNWSTHPRSRQKPLTAAVWSHSVISTVSQVLFPKSHLLFFSFSRPDWGTTNVCFCDKVSSCERMWGLCLTVQRVKLRYRRQREKPQTSQGYFLPNCFPGFLLFFHKRTNVNVKPKDIYWSCSKTSVYVTGTNTINTTTVSAMHNLPVFVCF